MTSRLYGHGHQTTMEKVIINFVLFLVTALMFAQELDWNCVGQGGAFQQFIDHTVSPNKRGSN